MKPVRNHDLSAAGSSGTASTKPKALLTRCREGLNQRFGKFARGGDRGDDVTDALPRAARRPPAAATPVAWPTAGQAGRPRSQRSNFGTPAGAASTPGKPRRFTQNPKPTEGNMTKEKPQPVHRIRFGKLKAVIWLNSSAAGSWHNVQVSRLFKREEDDGWSDSDSFGRDDLLTLAEILRQAYLWIMEAEGRTTNTPGQAGENHATE